MIMSKNVNNDIRRDSPTLSTLDLGWDEEESGIFLGF